MRSIQSGTAVCSSRQFFYKVEQRYAVQYSSFLEIIMVVSTLEIKCNSNTHTHTHTCAHTRVGEGTGGTEKEQR